jgi:hypothetical protein
MGRKKRETGVGSVGWYKSGGLLFKKRGCDEGCWEMNYDKET